MEAAGRGFTPYLRRWDDDGIAYYAGREPTAMKWYINVDPGAIKTNREQGGDFPTCTVQAEDMEEPIKCHGVKINGESELRYFREGERSRLGAHVSLVTEAPIEILHRTMDGQQHWRAL
jgi:hypothetical protein